MAPLPFSMNLGTSANVWQGNMCGPRSLLIASAWRSGINVLLNIPGAYSKTMLMIFPKPSHALLQNSLVSPKPDGVHDVLNHPRDKIHTQKGSRCLEPLQLIIIILLVWLVGFG